ncbi:MAG: Hydrogen peroxide-inducible genes activator _ OxyR, partial [uncultured Sphingomonadaceae bacterium]
DPPAVIAPALLSRGAPRTRAFRPRGHRELRYPIHAVGGHRRAGAAARRASGRTIEAQRPLHGRRRGGGQARAGADPRGRGPDPRHPRARPAAVGRAPHGRHTDDRALPAAAHPPRPPARLARPPSVPAGGDDSSRLRVARQGCPGLRAARASLRVRGDRQRIDRRRSAVRRHAADARQGGRGRDRRRRHRSFAVAADGGRPLPSGPRPRRLRSAGAPGTRDDARHLAPHAGADGRQRVRRYAAPANGARRRHPGGHQRRRPAPRRARRVPHDRARLAQGQPARGRVPAARRRPERGRL